MSTVTVTLIGKPGCHLCDEARDAILTSRASLAARGIQFDLVERDILQNERLARLHAESIPVVQIDGKQHTYWRVDPQKFEAAVERSARKPSIFSRKKKE